MLAFARALSELSVQALTRTKGRFENNERSSGHALASTTLFLEARSRRRFSSPFLQPAVKGQLGFWGSRGCQQGGKARGSALVTKALEEFASEDFVLDRMLGSFGFMNVSTYSPPGSGAEYTGYEQRDADPFGKQEVGEGIVQTRLYAGRFKQGQYMNAKVILKAYPYLGVGSADEDVDAMAANEVAAHCAIQPAEYPPTGFPISYLLGGFQTQAKEKWLVFRNSGTVTAADYAQAAATATALGQPVGEGEFMDRFDKNAPLKRRRAFVVQLLRGTMTGLSVMHQRGWLHQSLGPASITLNTTKEREASFLQARLRDLSFAVQVGDGGLGGVTLGELWDTRNTGRGLMDKRNMLTEAADSLWRRAARAGARMAMERRAFGIADDVYAAGLLVAYMAFVPFCEFGSVDGPSLQRLLETTFRLDLEAARDYCAADDRWTEAVKFLDAGDRAGWQLLQAMLNPEYRLRPTAESVLSHPFLTGAALS